MKSLSRWVAGNGREHLRYKGLRPLAKSGWDLCSRFGAYRLWIQAAAILLLLFGAKRVPQLAKSLGVGARELKKAASEDPDESETKEASVQDGAEARTKVVSEGAAFARDEDRAERQAGDQ